MSAGVDPEKVIAHLAQQVGQKAADLAMAMAALDAAHERIAELGERGDAGSQPEEGPGES